MRQNGPAAVSFALVFAIGPHVLVSPAHAALLSSVSALASAAPALEHSRTLALTLVEAWNLLMLSSRSHFRRRTGRRAPVAFLLVCCLPYACQEPESYDSPEGEDWIDVAVGRHNITCGLHADGTGECWGYDAEHGMSAPIEAMVDIEAGSAVCGLDAGGVITCGAVMNDAFSIAPPEDSAAFTALAVGHTQVCGLTVDGRVVCKDAEHDIAAWSAGPGSSEYVSICAGRDFTCGVLDSGHLDCWEREEEAHWTAPDGEFLEVACGEYISCARSADGDAYCWERGNEITEPDGPVTRVSAGNFPCGVTTSGELTCTSVDSPAVLSVDLPSGNDFVAVAAGTVQVCGLRSGGGIACGQVHYEQY